MASLIQFVPVYQERVWGGRSLEGFLGRRLPGTSPIGESWELVDRPEAQSIVMDGPWKGETLGAIVANRRAEVMGPRWPVGGRFPILVKWLDCRERLSLQVHPPAAVAHELGGEPKTENWYVAHAEPGAAVLAGLRPGVDARRFESAIADNSAESLVYRLPTQTGDSLLIRSGVVHAIDGGNVILEIQQNSDTTYRVYDWGRMGLDGKPRTMHVEQSLASIAANTAGTPNLVRNDATESVLAECAEFRIRRLRMNPGDRLKFAAGEEARIVSVVSGRLRSDQDHQLGDNLLVPFAAGVNLVAESPATILITDHFSMLENQSR